MAILARISDKDKQTQLSLDAQIRETREMLVAPNGWNVVAEYAVKHRSADVLGDPTFNQMIADARAGKFSKLCLHKFDRLGRRAYEREVSWHILNRECGVEIRAALEPYDLTTRAGKLTKKTSEFIADIYLDNLSEEVRKGMRQKVLAGGWVSRAPFGYVIRREDIAHNKRRSWLEVDPEEGPVARLVFEMYASGQHTLDSLAEWLNSQGYLHRHARPWTRSHVHRVLTNPVYHGLVRWDGLEVAGSHEPLIDPELFDRCFTMLREHDADKDRRSRQVYVANRVLVFSELGCGAGVDYQAHARTKYYRSKASGPDGSKVYVACDVVDGALASLLAELEIPPEVQPQVRATWRRDLAELGRPHRSETERLRQRLAQLETESRSYVRLRAQEKISEEEFDQERARVSAAIAASRYDLSMLSEGADGRMADLELALTVAAGLRTLWSQCDDAHRKALVEMIFRRISIDNSGGLTGYDLASPFAYLLRLKKAATPLLEEGLPDSSNRVAKGSPNI